MPKHPLSFILCLLFSITFIAISPVQMAHADDLSQGMQLYRAKKYREAVPYLEKAAKEGHDEALKALDEIYADQTPAVDMTDSKAPATEGKAAGKTAGDDKPADTRAGAEKVPAPMYEKATVAEDPKEVADRAFMRKVLFLSTAVIIVLIWVVQYFLLRKLRNRNFRKETPADTAKTAKTAKTGKPGKNGK